MEKYFYLSAIFWVEKYPFVKKNIWIGACLEHNIVTQDYKLTTCIHDLYELIYKYIIISRREYDGTLNFIASSPEMYQKIFNSTKLCLSVDGYNKGKWETEDSQNPIYIFLHKKISEDIWKCSLSEDNKYAIMEKTGETI